MANHTPIQSNSRVVQWIDSRLPIFSMLSKEYGVFPTPRNFNYFWNFGAIAMFMLVTMIITGLFLAMNYQPSTTAAFDSVERIMRDVNGGWLLRYLHANGASFFFIAVYIHIFRGMYYGSYKKPRELLWILGVTILLLMMATAFMGYVLPWGQMSFWGATVITNLFSAIPLVGHDIVTLLWGGFSVDNPTLNRFFALHFLLPFVICAVVFLHVWALHVTGSNNPLGIDVKTPQDTLPFHPYYTVKDMFGLSVFLLLYFGFVFFAPNFLGHPDNYIPADPMVTPAHIVPEWYFLPFYAILRAVPDIVIPFTGIVLMEAKLAGVLAMFGSIAMLFILPWLDTSPVRSARFRPLYRIFFLLFAANCLVLGWAGGQPAEGGALVIARIATAYYFAFFVVILPVLGRIEKPLPLPISIASAVLKKAVVVLAVLFLGVGGAMAAGEAPKPPQMDWSFHGPFGKFDRAAAQRGFQVYKEVCASCHAMKQKHYRNLADLGFSEAEVKAIAAAYTVKDGPNDEGEMFERPGRPADRFVSPFANKNAARAANNGAYPVDLSLIVKARHDGANYVHGLLTGYETPPGDMKMNAGMNYNKYFPGHQIAMASPLNDGQVTYSDGTEATVEQMSRDVTTFLAWAAEPEMEERKEMGIRVLLFVAGMALLFYLSKRKLWKKVKA
jgi:ubiquinol-cytochrome c reductase cytochrome b/c1 subunit